MEIKPTYVDFNTAKLLKEKGYPQTRNNLRGDCYNHKGEFRGDVIEYVKAFVDKDKEGIKKFASIVAPEQWQVVEWLRVNHGIWIPINPKREKINGVNEMWYDAEVWKLEPDEIKGYGWSELVKPFETPQEAYSAAFDYILNNLI